MEELEKLVKDFKVSIEQNMLPKLDEKSFYKLLEGLAVKSREKVTASELIDILLKSLINEENFLELLTSLIPSRVLERWKEKGLLPIAPVKEIFNSSLKAGFGINSNPFDLILQAVKCSIVGLGCSMILYKLRDLIYGVPTPRNGYIGLGTLSNRDVNIIIKGLPIVLIDTLFKEMRKPEIVKMVQENGANGINIVGLGAFGLDLLVRYGTPSCGGALDIERVVSTGCVDLVILDDLCNLFSISSLAESYGTKFLSFSPLVAIENVSKMKYTPRNSEMLAKSLLKSAVDHYNRRKQVVKLPEEKLEVKCGFSVEYLKTLPVNGLSILSKAINDGKIKGIVLIVGCEKLSEDDKSKVVEFVKKLIKNDILVLCSGCWIYSIIDILPMVEEGTKDAGNNLKEVCKELSIPPVVLLGSCTELGRGFELFMEISKENNIDLKDLPVTILVINYVNNLVLNLGISGASLGFTSFISGSKSLGSEEVLRILQDEVGTLTGGRIIVETDLNKTFETLFDLIIDKSKLLTENI